MAEQPWQDYTVDELPDEYEEIIGSYPAAEDELEVYKSWKPMGDWVDWALCAEVDPALWHPHENSSDVHRAKAICEGCPVQEECLLDAIDRDDPWGIWGGMTYPERMVEMVRRGLEPSSAMVADGERRHLRMRGRMRVELMA